MRFSKRRDERERRALAQQHKGEVVAGSGRALKPRKIPPTPVSVRMDAESIARLRQTATDRGLSLSELIRSTMAWTMTWDIDALERAAVDSTVHLPRTFRCEHFSFGNVAAARCGICGPLVNASAF